MRILLAAACMHGEVLKYFIHPLPHAFKLTFLEILACLHLALLLH